ncbi:glycoside hydrolase family 73 protein [Enterococcus quebecensis]|uniref:Histidine kinase n=1 Tax=Enterococcus quebecensis TaxID=903983 RepID=A0A1E5H3S3_9ENTE|nr:glycoside hydrolase family 73 protein [Enterococcus quebecensis]OEG19556.1 histidine kinase [Enterococcus quebecensis]OJG75166.1 hypothetical protein RV12_GL001771 [Enterococcus quebecensis]
MNQVVLKKQNIFPILLILLLSVASILLILNKEEAPIQDETIAYQQNFIDDIAAEAKLLQKQTNLFASITIAQAILESDWGRSDLAVEAKNLFGIKGAYNEQSSIMPTDEFIDGERITIDDSFKKYNTIQESMIDHIEFLKGGTYEAIKTSKNYQEAAVALQNGGYATDPDYAEKLIELIEEFKLNRYDK